jgi:hypothetical protein
MKRFIPTLAALTLAFVATTAMAQEDPARMQEQQQACETDVYTFCNDAIPDHDRIAACLRKHWSEISRACRRVMSGQRRRHRGDVRHRSESDS